MTSLEHGFTDEDDMEQWPEERIDIVGHNSNEGDHYKNSEEILEDMEKLFNHTLNRYDGIINSLLHLDGEYVKIIARDGTISALLDDGSLFVLHEGE